MAKFSKGQQVWGRSPWGGYIAEPYTISGVDVREGGETFYHVKGKRKLFHESELHETEDEVQLMLADNFKAEYIGHLQNIVSACRRIGCVDMAKEKIVRGEQLMLGTPEHGEKRRFCTDRNNPPELKFSVGQKVYGHLYTTNLEELPKEYEIKTAKLVYVLEFGNIPSHWECVYTVKRHGSFEVDESLLYATMDEALMATIDYFKDGFASVFKSFQSRAKALGIETEMQQAMLANSNTLLLLD